MRQMAIITSHGVECKVKLKTIKKIVRKKRKRCIGEHLMSAARVLNLCIQVTLIDVISINIVIGIAHENNYDRSKWLPIKLTENHRQPDALFNLKLIQNERAWSGKSTHTFFWQNQMRLLGFVEYLILIAVENVRKKRPFNDTQRAIFNGLTMNGRGTLTHFHQFFSCLPLFPHFHSSFVSFTKSRRLEIIVRYCHFARTKPVKRQWPNNIEQTNWINT